LLTPSISLSRCFDAIAFPSADEWGLRPIFLIIFIFIAAIEVENEVFGHLFPLIGAKSINFDAPF